MTTVVLDREFAESLREERAAAGADRWDEVWEGTYMMTPLPNIEHQDIASGLVAALRTVLRRDQAVVLAGTNVSDREAGWMQNYRCPDVAVFLVGNPAKNCGTHWNGGADFAVEIVSDDDRSREKIPFYAKIGTRELLIVDRDPWSLELVRLNNSELQSVGKSTLDNEQVLAGESLPMTFCLVRDEDRPSILMTHIVDGKRWRV
jgi:Uma2 family endonuclease